MREPGRVVAKKDWIVDRRSPNLACRGDSSSCADDIQSQRAFSGVELLVGCVAEALWQVDGVRQNWISEPNQAAPAVVAQRERAVLRHKKQRIHGEGKRAEPAPGPRLNNSCQPAAGPNRAIVVAEWKAGVQV